MRRSRLVSCLRRHPHVGHPHAGGRGRRAAGAGTDREIARVKSAKSIGVRSGNWLALEQAQALLNAPDITTTTTLRERAISAVLLGCARRRSEVAALTFSEHRQSYLTLCVIAAEGSTISRRFCCRRARTHHGVNGIALKPRRINRTAIVCSSGT